MKSEHFDANSAGCLTADRTAHNHSLAGRLQSGLADWYQAWQKKRLYQRDMQHVAQFNDYLLRDIGLNPSDIADIGRTSHFASTDRIGRPG